VTASSLSGRSSNDGRASRRLCAILRFVLVSCDINSSFIGASQSALRIHGFVQAIGEYLARTCFCELLDCRLPGLSGETEIYDGDARCARLD
jgi:hypothetical protein